MKERTKKLLSLLSVTTMCVGLLAGCGGADPQQSSASDSVQESTSQDTGSSADASNASSETPAEPEEFTYPMEHVKLTINFGQENDEWGSISAEEAFSDPDKYLMGAIGVLSQASGAYVETNGVSWDSRNEEFTYMLIAHDLPDIMVNCFNKSYKGGPAAAIDGKASAL